MTNETVFFRNLRGDLIPMKASIADMNVRKGKGHIFLADPPAEILRQIADETKDDGEGADK